MTEFTPPAGARLAHSGSIECELGQDCDQLAAGHALSFMRLRLAAATPTKWRDAIVDEVSEDGHIRLTTIADQQTILLWHHTDAGQSLGVGDPVALHDLYQVLAVGRAWLSVSIEGF